MPYELLKSLDREIWIKVSGLLSTHDFQACQALVELGAESFHRARVLIVLEGFQGWSKEEEWMDTAFLPDSEIAKLAIVGDPRWEEEVFLFAGKPMRETDMKFFPPEQIDVAKAWLDE